MRSCGCTNRTSRRGTKLILMSHVINITGQIMPVKQVVAMARAKGISVIVDGAHALAQFQFKISDLECDYYGVSLHKWLTAPHGTGLLYVRREKINGLWPLMASKEKQDDDIRKFEEIGTHPLASCLAIAEALTFHQSIGDANKEVRLRLPARRLGHAPARGERPRATAHEPQVRVLMLHRHGAGARFGLKATGGVAGRGASDSGRGDQTR